MNFKQWLENLINIDSQMPRNKWNLIVNQAIIDLDLDWPTPTNQLGSGLHANVYNTTDPTKVIRISKDMHNDCEKAIAKDAMQMTGGVNKIYDIVDYKDYSISLKEKLNTNWLHKLKNKYGENQEIKDILSSIASSNFMGDENVFDNLKFYDSLRNIPELKNLWHAILIGKTISSFDTGDINLGNLAIDKNDNLVIIDC
jgi:hypothetical protein